MSGKVEHEGNLFIVTFENKLFLYFMTLVYGGN